MNKKLDNIEKVNVWDIDGCFVLGFNAKFNEAEYAEQIKKQPVCEPFARFAEKEAKSAKNYVVTGRKESLLGDITKKTIERYIEGTTYYIFYPEEAKYDDTYHKWKFETIKNIIDENEQTNINIYDDDKKVIASLKEYNNERVRVFLVKSDVDGFTCSNICKRSN